MRSRILTAGVQWEHHILRCLTAAGSRPSEGTRVDGERLGQTLTEGVMPALCSSDAVQSGSPPQTTAAPVWLARSCLPANAAVSARRAAWRRLRWVLALLVAVQLLLAAGTVPVAATVHH